MRNAMVALASAWTLLAMALIGMAIFRDARQRRRKADPTWSGYKPPFAVTVAAALLVQAALAAIVGDADWTLVLLTAGVNGLAATAAVSSSRSRGGHSRGSRQRLL